MFVFKGLTVIDITESNHEVQEFSTLVAYKMKFESEEPTHGTFASLRYSFEHLVNLENCKYIHIP